MKTKPILFNGEMIRALLDGRKTQTRRQIKPQPEYRENEAVPGCFGTFFHGWNLDHEAVTVDDFVKHCPHGQVGDLLYVRETWGLEGSCAEIKIASFSDPEFHFKTHLKYKGDNGYDDVTQHWRPSIHMPRWASRLTLRITNVHVERLQDISKEDALLEGLKKWPHKNDYAYGYDGGAIDGYASPTGAFQSLWNSIYKNWNKNPWVWVIEFEVIHRNIDEVIAGLE